MLRTMGGDLVGMSTVPEIIVARHCSMRVLAFSLVTNNAILTPGPCGDDINVQHCDRQSSSQILEIGKASHEEVLKAGQKAANDVQVRSTERQAGPHVLTSCRILSHVSLQIY